jgi:hypothetical protein
MTTTSTDLSGMASAYTDCLDIPTRGLRRFAALTRLGPTSQARKSQPSGTSRASRSVE